jgi:hypothetical protein
MAGSTLKKPIRGRKMGVGALYDLSKDLSEENNVAKARPERLAELVSIWEKMNGEMSEPLF